MPQPVDSGHALMPRSTLNCRDNCGWPSTLQHVNLALRRDQPFMAMRIWTGNDGPLPLPSGSTAVEWAGRIGHPSSYALLGGSLVPHQEPQHDFGRVDNPLAGGLDRVNVGLLPEYREAVNTATAGRLHVTAAAHGDVSSSQSVFARVATFLLALLTLVRSQLTVAINRSAGAALTRSHRIAPCRDAHRLHE